MQPVNYQKELDRIIGGLTPQEKPHLLLHSCCAPCSSYVLEYLSPYFRITDLYYNPNIYPAEEYHRRSSELHRLIGEMGLAEEVDFIESDFKPEEFFQAVSGLEHIPEGGSRCFACYELRLREAAVTAGRLHCDYFCTTLTISPLKNAAKLNEIGERLAQEYGVRYLPSDFKKRDGYKRSIALSARYDLYRQDYCGCVFSKQERQRQKADKQTEQS